MIELKICQLSFSSALLRYYLMMGVALIGGFLGFIKIAAILAIAVAVSCILGIRIEWKTNKEIKSKETQAIPSIPLKRKQQLQVENV